jgi:hypothetical protein
MRRPRRRGLLLAILGAALLSSPGGTWGARLADGPPLAREYASVGRVLSRRVDGRTVVLIPVAGPVRPRLSEPFRVGNRWRLYVTLEGARLGINAEPRLGPGVLDIVVAEAGSDVRIAIDVPSMTSYGTKPAEEGLLLWIEDEGTAEHRAQEQARALPVIGDGPTVDPVREPAPPDPPGSTGWVRFLLLVLAAAGLGLAFRGWKRRGTMPAWVAAAGAMLGTASLSALRSKVFGGATETDTDDTEAMAPDAVPETIELRKTG